MHQPAQQSVKQLIDKELDEGRGMDEIVSRFRNCVLSQALDRCQYNQVHTAQLLKTHRNTIVNWIREFGLHDEVQRKYRDTL